MITAITGGFKAAQKVPPVAGKLATVTRSVLLVAKRNNSKKSI